MRQLNTWRVGIGMAAGVLMFAGTAHAGGVVVPELGAAPIASGLGLLTGGVLILRAYWRSR